MSYTTNSVSVNRYSHSGGQVYYYRVVVSESEVKGLTSKVKFELQQYANRNNTLWYNGVSSTNVSTVGLWVNGTEVSKVPTGELSGTTYRYTATTTPTTIATYETELTRDPDGSYNGTCGFLTYQGSGSAGLNYGPVNSNQSSIFDFGTPDKGMEESTALNVKIKLEAGWTDATGAFIKTDELVWEPITAIRTKTNDGWK